MLYGCYVARLMGSHRGVEVENYVMCYKGLCWYITYILTVLSIYRDFQDQV